VEEEGQSRKVRAREHIGKDELILFVPKSRLITLELAQQLPPVRRLLQQRVVLKSPKHSQLALFLLEHF
jgi:histone-lysine N-methyltransferase SETD3